LAPSGLRFTSWSAHAALSGTVTACGGVDQTSLVHGGRVRIRPTVGSGSCKTLWTITSYLIAERNASVHTISNYRREIAQFMGFARPRGAREWGDVTPALLRQWLATLHAQGYVKASVVRRVSELRAFYAWMVRSDRLDVNPVQAISLPGCRGGCSASIAKVEALRMSSAGLFRFALTGPTGSLVCWRE
jgi:hypothetical protein